MKKNDPENDLRVPQPSPELVLPWLKEINSGRVCSIPFIENTRGHPDGRGADLKRTRQDEGEVSFKCKVQWRDTSLPRRGIFSHFRRCSSSLSVTNQESPPLDFAVPWAVYVAIPNVLQAPRPAKRRSEITLLDASVHEVLSMSLQLV